MDILPGIGYGIRQFLNPVLGKVDYIESQPLRRLSANPWKGSQFID
jgi:hypothetical protein